MSNWISVKDRLPEDQDECFIFVPTFDSRGVKSTPYVLHGTYWEECEEWTTCEGENFSIDEVTHWQPLPEPPEEDR